jgi:hypothetical protein
MRSDACVPSDSSSPTVPCSRASVATAEVRTTGGRGSSARYPSTRRVRRPGRPRRVVRRGLDAEEGRLTDTGEDDRVPALHPPEVRQVEDVVRRAGDDRVEHGVGHERADPLQLGVVTRPGHSAILLVTCHDRLRPDGPGPPGERAPRVHAIERSAMPRSPGREEPGERKAGGPDCVRHAVSCAQERGLPPGRRRRTSSRRRSVLRGGGARRRHDEPAPSSRADARSRRR